MHRQLRQRGRCLHYAFCIYGLFMIIYRVANGFDTPGIVMNLSTFTITLIASTYTQNILEQCQVSFIDFINLIKPVFSSQLESRSRLLSSGPSRPSRPSRPSQSGSLHGWPQRHAPAPKQRPGRWRWRAGYRMAIECDNHGLRSWRQQWGKHKGHNKQLQLALTFVWLWLQNGIIMGFIAVKSGSQ